MSVVLKLENLHKEYPGVVAVKDMSFELHEGEVLALLGENGAGKSTISKMICGIEKPDSGKLYFGGEEVRFDSAYDAMHKGITMVHQELSMVGDMSIAENIYINRQPVNGWGNVKWSKLYADTKKILESFNLDLDPRMLVKRLPLGVQQLLEIIRATSMEGKLIILDEPTSSLADEQIQLMFENIRRLKAAGYAFIYITHKMEEVFQIADRILVMRDGNYVGENKIQEVDNEQIVTMMVGREIKQLYGADEKPREISRDYLFEVKNLSSPDLYENISFGAKKGEILGIAGLIGAGRTEAALGIFGAHKHSGTIKLHGKEVIIHSTADAIKNRIAYISEDRKGLGLYLDYSIIQNIAIMQLDNYTSKTGMVKDKDIETFAMKQIKEFNVATPSAKQIIGNLSGGNQQKCLLAMWLGIDPEVIIIDEPTKGVDVGAKAEIYQMLRNMAERSKTVIVISSELPELLGICDRIVVMHEGTVSGEVSREEFSEERIMGFATGISNDKCGGQANG